MKECSRVTNCGKRVRELQLIHLLLAKMAHAVLGELMPPGTKSCLVILGSQDHQAILMHSSACCSRIVWISVFVDLKFPLAMAPYITKASSGSLKLRIWQRLPGMASCLAHASPGLLDLRLWHFSLASLHALDVVWISGFRDLASYLGMALHM